MTWRNTILVGDVRERLRGLSAESVHCVVTSPPYWGLRDYGTEGQLGLEPTPEQFVCNLVDVFREVRRVLRSDGTVWLNMGDSYVSSPRGNAPGDLSTSSLTNPQRQDAIARPPGRTSQRVGRANVAEQLSVERRIPGLKPKDMVGIPWRVAFALQADGWWLRSDIIWSKPNPMPESVTDRPTKAHEYVFLLSKSATYFYDAEAIREPAQYGRRQWSDVNGNMAGVGLAGYRGSATVSGGDPAAGRNKRTVWEIPTEPYADAHFATFPTALVLPCIQAGTSEHGVCSVCGAPWRRVLEVADPEGRLGVGYHDHTDDLGRGQRGVPEASGAPVKRTVGWQPTCKHEAPIVRAVVLDPFLGSGTTADVAKRAGRDYVGVELNPEYVEMAKRRIGDQAVLL